MLTEHDLAAIRAAIEKDAAAVRRADWDAITRMFTADDPVPAASAADPRPGGDARLVGDVGLSLAP